MTGLIEFFFFKQKTAYEMRISDWSSDVCSSDLVADRRRQCRHVAARYELRRNRRARACGRIQGSRRQSQGPGLWVGSVRVPRKRQEDRPRRGRGFSRRQNEDRKRVV